MISIIYFAYIPDKGPWQDIIYKHIDHLIASQITRQATVYIHIASSNPLSLSICKHQVQNRLPGAIISESNINQFEYPGIYKVWEVAQKNPSPDHYILYFHSKGMSHKEPLLRHSYVDILFNHTIGRWQEILSLFKEKSYIHKIGLAPDPLGWIWFNFWWARASYLFHCPQPIVTSNRYYYEGWLSLNKNKQFTEESSYCLAPSGPNSRFTAAAAIPLLQLLGNISIPQKTRKKQGFKKNRKRRRDHASG